MDGFFSYLKVTFDILKFNYFFHLLFFISHLQNVCWFSESILHTSRICAKFILACFNVSSI